MDNYWKSFGTSVRGPGHVRSGTPNQDSFLTLRRRWGDVVVVSDGVGSHKTSEYGSRAACLSVYYAAQEWKDTNTDTLISSIQSNWLSFIRPFDPQKSAATCLFAIRRNTDIILGMLGDGLISVLRRDGSYFEIIENKDVCFSNQTSALSEKTQIDSWHLIKIDPNVCNAILLCTDGVADDLLPNKRIDFIRHIYEQSKKYSICKIYRELKSMLENWPVPKHSDDKTIACLFRL